MNIGSYPTVFAIGHKAIEGIFNDPVIVEEKIDGSQFSMTRTGGELSCRSKGQQLIIDAPDKLFARAVDTAKELDLREGWIYRCEYLQKPKHNTLAYGRIPEKHLILFDVATGLETYLAPEEKRDEAERIGLECVPVLYRGKIDSVEFFRELLDTVSVLGGVKVEGVVVKNYSVFTKEKKVAIGKYVSEAFKEIHAGEWRKSNPTNADITDQLIQRYRTPARWQKAVQHLRDIGRLEGSPRDIGNLILEVADDIEKECGEEIRELLFKYHWSKIRRSVAGGLPEWYKQQLLEGAFKPNEN